MKGASGDGSRDGGGVMAGVLLAILTIAGRPSEVSGARRFVTETLIKALGEDHSTVETARLLTSETVTNAATHSFSGRDGGTITVAVIDVAYGVRIEVVDDGADTVPGMSAEEGLSEHGRGLTLIDAFAARWGWVRDSAGLTLWLEIDHEE